MTEDTAKNLEGEFERLIAASRLFGGSDPEQKVGRFVPIRLLGKGGMGAVYSAYDEQLNRRVALKVLRANRSGFAEAHARILREAQAMAQLSHPNVAQIYDVGDYHGQLFIAMEYIEGVTLTTWLKERPRGWQEVLPAFLSSGEGLHAAHLAGMVHRDFKPDNVMLGDDGRVRVMDFGLARLDMGEPNSLSTASTSTGADRSAQPLTETGALLGTPGYMAPEQRAGHPVDAKADQYSFCVALYEALYGVSPFDEKTLTNDSYGGENSDFRPAMRQVPRWIHRAIMRGLEDDPQSRWPSMAPLLTALRDNPSRRRWRMVGLGLALVGLSGVWGWRHIEHEQRVAKCKSEGAQAKQLWNPDVRQGVHSAMLASGLPFAAHAFEFLAPRLDSFAMEWSSAARETCMQARVMSAMDDAAYHRAQVCLGERLMGFSELVSALSHPDRGAVTRATTAVTSLPSVSSCRDRRQLWKADVIETPDIESLKVSRALAHASALQLTADFTQAVDASAIAKEQARAVGAPVQLAQARVLRGSILAEQDRADEARAELESAYLTALKFGADEVAAQAAQSLVFVVGHKQSNHAEGLLWGRVAEVTFHRLAKDTARYTSGLLSNLALVHSEQGEYALARDMYRQALAQDIELYGSAHPELTVPLTNLGLMYIDIGEPGAAYDPLHTAYALSARFYGPEHPETARALLHLGFVFEKAGAYDEAEASFRRALEIFGQSPGIGPGWTAGVLNDLAAISQSRGDYDESRLLLQASLDATERAYGKRHIEYASALHNLGAVLDALGRSADARSLGQQALLLRLQLVGRSHPSVAKSLFLIGLTYKSDGTLAKANEYFEEARTVAEQAFGPHHPEVALPLRGLAAIAEERESYTEAQDYLKRALTILESTLGDAHPDIADVLIELGEVELQTGESGNALDHFISARGILEDSGGDLKAVHIGMGKAFIALGRFDAAANALALGLDLQRSGDDDKVEIADTEVLLSEAMWIAGRDPVHTSALLADAFAIYEALGEAGKPGLVAARAAHARHARKRAHVSRAHVQ